MLHFNSNEFCSFQYQNSKQFDSCLYLDGETLQITLFMCSIAILILFMVLFLMLIIARALLPNLIKKKNYLKMVAGSGKNHASGGHHSGHGDIGKAASAYPDRFPNSCEFRVPDWRSYKVDGIPELESHRSKLMNKGLRDPWIRNQAWLFDQKVGAYPQWRISLRTAFFGFRYAMVALATCLITEKILEKAFPPFHGHIHLYNPDKPHSHDHHSDQHHHH
ncbi:unnamed protein product [Rotaria magnacalcarata]|uniref:NADH dehydrogenase [ubiquinone] 1 beta subcomplex subunit 3 n=1 Tax=Rotaria magnacalcarata TaxID=392030 RepID=A0A8S2NWT1_9BILA|nr:unnamed protein product [Rotaria magnacalcarata]CAF4708120.1 unnamed protein product [Rotaria magnacalcarata]